MQDQGTDGRRLPEARYGRTGPRLPNQAAGLSSYGNLAWKASQYSARTRAGGLYTLVAVPRWGSSTTILAMERSTRQPLVAEPARAGSRHEDGAKPSRLETGISSPSVWVEPHVIFRRRRKRGIVGCQRFWTVLGPRDWGEEAPGLRVSLTS